MNVFILCTGRSGSTTFVKACSHITNYSSGHETRTKLNGVDRFSFPENHIEGDNRLSWLLGQLDGHYGNDAFYVHLIRKKEGVAGSYMKRWKGSSSIIKAYTAGIKMRRPQKLNKEQKYQYCLDYYDTINKNIEFFLRDKSNKMVIRLEEIENGFEEFWSKIGAEGDYEKARQELRVKHNATKKRGFFKKIFHDIFG